MADESAGIDAYETVLADLRAKRDQIDQAIKAIEALRGGTPSATPTSPSQTTQSDDPGAFLGMSMHEATRKLLASRRRPLGNAEILTALKAGGLVMRSADPINTIGSVLTRRFHDVGDVVRVGRGTWGLPEWYPNRSWKKKNGVKGEAGSEAKTETTGPEPPLRQKPDDLAG